MIYAAFKVYAYCEMSRKSWGKPLRWQEWKAGFKKAQQPEHLEANKYALSAVKAIDLAERLYSPLQKDE